MNRPKVPSASLDLVTTGETLMADTLAIPRTIAGLFEQVVAQVEERVGADVARSAPSIVLSGVGDLLHASQATEHAFGGLTGVPTVAMPSMRLGLYDSLTLPSGALIFQMSFSGRPDRVVETCGLARQRGARVWSVTLDDGSPLAAASDATFGDVGVPVDGAGYQLATLVLLLIAIRIAELRGRLSAAVAAALRAMLRRSTDEMQATLAACADEATALARRFAGAEHALFLATGPAMGAAANGAARFVEATGWNASAMDIEEWTHLNRFAADRRSPNILIVPPGPSRARALEVMAAMRRLAKPVVVVAAAEDRALAAAADHVLPVSTALPEEFAPLVYNLPGELFANAVSIGDACPPYRQGDPLYAGLGEVRWGGHVQMALPPSLLDRAATDSDRAGSVK